MKSLKLPLTGGCQCGQIRYQVTDQPLTLYLCHCLDCQKQSSSAFGMSLWANFDQFELTTGILSFWDTRGESGNIKRCAFCNQCGSRIYHTSDKPGDQLSLKAGSLDDTTGLRPIAQLWTKSAQTWTPLDLEQVQNFETEPGSDRQLIDLWNNR